MKITRKKSGSALPMLISIEIGSFRFRFSVALLHPFYEVRLKDRDMAK
jgi:hypothetical protein